MKITSTVSPALMSMAREHGVEVKVLINFVLTALESLAKEPPGTVLAFYNPSNDKIISLKTPSAKQESAATNDLPKLVLVTKQENDT